MNAPQPQINHELILRTLLADPKFRAAVSEHAPKSKDQSPSGKVRESVHAAALNSQFASHADKISELAERHAQAALPASSMPDRSAGMAADHHRGVLNFTNSPDRRVAQAATQRETPRTEQAASRHPLLKNARRARDGNLYVPDPHRPGKYLMVVHKNMDHERATRTERPDSVNAPQGVHNGNVREILFQRHGATKLNDNDTSVDRLRGWKDVPLSPEGLAHTDAAAKDIAKKFKPDVILSSDLCRGRQTADILSKYTGTPVTDPNSMPDPHAFRPWHVGKFAGQISKTAIPILAQYAHDKPDAPLPGGESFNQFRGRFFGGLADALQKHQGLVAIVSHHRTERLLKAWAAKGHPADGSIDIGTFNQKGEPTGNAEVMQIPMDRLLSAARRNNAAMAARSGGAVADQGSAHASPR